MSDALPISVGLDSAQEVGEPVHEARSALAKRPAERLARERCLEQTDLPRIARHEHGIERQVIDKRVGAPVAHFECRLGLAFERLDSGLGEIFARGDVAGRSEEHTSELQSLMRISYAVFCLKKKTRHVNK